MRLQAFLPAKNLSPSHKLIKKGTGFTLIELMIVVAIIAIIVTLGLPVYNNYTIRAKISEGLKVATAAKTAISTTCQEDPTIDPLTSDEAGYDFNNDTNYISSVVISGSCATAIISVQTQTTGAVPDPVLTITGVAKQGHIDFSCVSSGPNRHVPDTCRS